MTWYQILDVFRDGTIPRRSMPTDQGPGEWYPDHIEPPSPAASHWYPQTNTLSSPTPGATKRIIDPSTVLGRLTTGSSLWEVEAMDITRIEDGGYSAEHIRLVRQVHLDESALRTFAADAAEHLLDQNPTNAHEDAILRGALADVRSAAAGRLNPERLARSNARAQDVALAELSGSAAEIVATAVAYVAWPPLYAGRQIGEVTNAWRATTHILEAVFLLDPDPTLAWYHERFGVLDDGLMTYWLNPALPANGRPVAAHWTR